MPKATPSVVKTWTQQSALSLEVSLKGAGETVSKMLAFYLKKHD